MYSKDEINDLFPPIIKDSDYKVVEMMEKYGGSFVEALSKAFYKADHINFNKLKEAFPEYWSKYKEFAKTVK